MFQLESVIRLAEARARLHCDDKVRPEYVYEATRLLQKSIIFVETDDVILEDTLDRSIFQVNTDVRTEPVTVTEQDDKGKEEMVEDQIVEEDEKMEEEVNEEERAIAEGEASAAAAVTTENEQKKSRKRKRKSEKKSKKSEKKAKKEITITFEKYQQISNLLVMLLRKKEEAEGDTFRGVTQRECMDLYLSEIKAESEEDIEVTFRF